MINKDSEFQAAVRAEVVAQLKTHAETSEKAMRDTLAQLLPNNPKVLEFVLRAIQIGNATMIAAADVLPLQTVKP